MFVLQDHLPLDRIITRFSAPTTIAQFQRSSLDGILIELARLVTHGANDNIFCLSGLIESVGGEDRGGVLTLSCRPPHEDKVALVHACVISSWSLLLPVHDWPGRCETAAARLY